uniref:MARVEL domain-containing protein n=1 Tax=Plectus sambesii TaxID=2011161 RepID=A0A914X3H1_9BILA
MHVATGAKVIAILITIGLVLQVIQSVVSFTGNSGHGGVLGMGVGSFIIGAAVVVCLFLGLRSERAVFLLPYLVVQGLGMIGCGLLIILCIIALASTTSGFAHDFVKGFSYNSSTPDDDAIRVMAIVFIVVFILYIAIQAWFFWVVYKCYVFFREQALYAHKMVVGYSG